MTTIKGMTQEKMRVNETTEGENSNKQTYRMYKYKSKTHCHCMILNRN